MAMGLNYITEDDRCASSQISLSFSLSLYLSLFFTALKFLTINDHVNDHVIDNSDGKEMVTTAEANRVKNLYHAFSLSLHFLFSCRIDEE